MSSEKKFTLVISTIILVAFLIPAIANINIKLNPVQQTVFNQTQTEEELNLEKKVEAPLLEILL